MNFFGVVQKSKFKHKMGGEGGFKIEIRNTPNDVVITEYFSIYPVSFISIGLWEPRKPVHPDIPGRKDSVS